MPAAWIFKKKLAGEKVRDPIQGEFFATEAIRGPAEALVREAIQNALDAKVPTPEPLRVRMFLAAGGNALSAERARDYFSGAWEHFRAERNGLRNVPTQSEPCSYLVVEDFETTGLQGSVEQSDDEPDVQNSFFYFFRAEGVTGKSEDERGRWGIGKYVFPRSSRVNSLFGITVRADDRQHLMMGQSVLKHHKVSGVSYRPDGDFGEQRPDGLVLPVSDPAVIAQFSNDFGVSRTASQPGLSVVVPYVDPDITESALIDAIIRGYFYPILTGGLVGTVATALDDETHLDDSTLLDEARDLPNAEELIPLIELAEWAAFRPAAEFFVTNDPSSTRAPKWSPEMISEETIKELTEKFRLNERLAIKVPVFVQRHGMAVQRSFFTVFLVRDGLADGRPVFIRDGIIISDMHAPRVRGVRSLVIVEDKPLATMLGDSENPAHTQWQKDSSNFRGKYERGPSWLGFVTKSVAEVVRLISESEREENPRLLIDVFSLPPEAEDEGEPTPQKIPSSKPGPEVEPAPDIPEPVSQPRYKLRRVAGGFAVMNGPGIEIPTRLEIYAAYDVRRGNPFTKYKRAAEIDAADFDVAQLPIRLEPAPVGVEIVSRAGNRLELIVREPQFELTVVGFDEQRDVITRVNVLQEPES